jgi:hypothetical protein
MTIDLPPRRKLPADVKERMRPHFAEVRTRRNHAPLAAAAGVALLIAGGVTVTRFLVQDPGTGHERVVVPSAQDVERCRTALNDPGWSSTEMVNFEQRKVLVGKDGRFCELTRSRGGVTPPNFQPTALDDGSITFRTRRLIAGVPPKGAHTAKVDPEPSAMLPGSSDAVVTSRFFIVYSYAAGLFGSLTFDDRTFDIPRLGDPQTEEALEGAREGKSDSFPSGDPDPWAPVNLIARCADNGFSINNTSAEMLDGFEPLIAYGLDRHNGLLVAHRDHRDHAYCVIDDKRENALLAMDSTSSKMPVTAFKSGSAYVLLIRTKTSATTVDVSTAGGPPATLEAADGFFILTVPASTAERPSAVLPLLHVVARDADKKIVYEGGVG